METEQICRVCGIKLLYSEIDLANNVQRWCSLSCCIRPDPIPAHDLGFDDGGLFGLLGDVEVSDG